jgi:serine/threonine-protein phosphatase 2A regulatory subunit B
MCIFAFTHSLTHSSTHRLIGPDYSFTADGRHVIARDYLSMKIWDLRMNNEPVKKIPVNSYLHPALNDLYENQCMFDKFRVVSSYDGSKVIAGSYRYLFNLQPIIHTVHDS